MKLTKLLCPIDFSPTSMHALEMAIALAKSSTAELVITHSWHLPALYYSELAFPSNVAQKMEAGSAAELEAALTIARKAGVERVSTRLLCGDPASTIVGLLEDEVDIELVVIGANGRGGFGRVLMGSVAEKVVRSAPCSVLAIHAAHAITAFRTVLCPIDFSESSLDAIELALTMRAPGGAVTLLHVHDLPLNYSDDPEVSNFLSKLDMKSAARLDALLASAAGHADLRAVSKITRIGNPGRQILALLESEPRYELVVMGTHGRTGLRRVLLGSIAEKVVRHAPCPVLVARKRASASAA